MAHQVIWTRYILDAFVREANLTDLEQRVMETRVAGMTITQQSYYFALSISSINRIIRVLKRKYDEAQKTSKTLPVRKTCAAELFLDEH